MNHLGMVFVGAGKPLEIFTGYLPHVNRAVKTAAAKAFPGIDMGIVTMEQATQIGYLIGTDKDTLRLANRQIIIPWPFAVILSWQPGNALLVSARKTGLLSFLGYKDLDVALSGARLQAVSVGPCEEKQVAEDQTMFLNLETRKPISYLLDLSNIQARA